MTDEPKISTIAALLGDPARAKMMTALMGGKALTATELAVEADISAQTASSHLAKLLKQQLLQMRKQGRHKYFQLNGHEVAELLESLLNISSKLEYSTVITGPKNPEMRLARVCYDHMAGALSIKLLNSLKAQHYLTEADHGIHLTQTGKDFFTHLGIDLVHLQQLSRPLCKPCLDWSERYHHLAGSLGKWILDDVFKKGWGKKDHDTRVIRFTIQGLKAFKRQYQFN